MYLETFVEIFAVSAFLIAVLSKKGEERFHEIFAFFLPALIYDFFLEAAGVYGSRYIFSDKFHLFMFGVPMLMAPFGFSLIVFSIIKITNKIFVSIKVSQRVAHLSLIDGIFALVFTTIIEATGQSLGLWEFSEEPFILGVPIVSPIGWFLAVFIFTFIYRNLRDQPITKRTILTYSYLFLVLGSKLAIDVFFIWA